MEQKMLLDTVALEDEKSALVILDQTLLPGEQKLLYLTEQNEIWEAIKNLRVRGAPAIGIAAAMGLYLAAKRMTALDHPVFWEEFLKAKAYLASSRPTAMNLFWALDRMERVAAQNADRPVSQIVALLKQEAEQMRREDMDCCRKIGENGLTLLQDGMGILTHCNAGRLATVRYGTATAPIYVGQEKGWRFQVYADETRPLLQGARLTCYELMAAGVDVTLLCDNMAASAMASGRISAVLVGCDRVAANGDVANKIGTSAVAILARHYHIPFYVCAPTSTIDPSCPTGAEIVIEQRDGAEVTDLWYQSSMAPKGVAVYNPAFDVTDHSLITALITEEGVWLPPFSKAIEQLW